MVERKTLNLVAVGSIPTGGVRFVFLGCLKVSLFEYTGNLISQ